MRPLLLAIYASLLLAPATAAAQDERPTVAVTVRGYGPMLPSEWREALLPAARRGLAVAHPGWRILPGAEVTALEAAADRQASPEGGPSLEALLRARYPGAEVLTLSADCGDVRCTVSGSSDALDVGAVWELQRSLRVRLWARALAARPRPMRMGHGRGFGGRGVVLAETFGTWSGADEAAARGHLRALGWPTSCPVERTTSLFGVLEVRSDGSYGELGMSSADRRLRRCVERAVSEGLEDRRLPASEHPRRIELIAIGRP